MSRSKRRTPVRGMTGAASEKQDKRLYNRRYRRVCKQVVHVDPARELLPLLLEHSNVGAMNKDGKFWFDPRERPELLRK